MANDRRGERDRPSPSQPIYRPACPPLVSHQTSTGLPEAAAAYAASGLRVFPCTTGGKRPLTSHGFKDATSDPAQIRAWWQRWPDANIGIATGWVYDVLDIDLRRSGTGFPAFNRAQKAGLVTGWASLVRTPSGGLHSYYPADPQRPQGSWTLASAHVDFRGIGGYVIAPPSAVDADIGRRVYQVIAVRNTGAPLDANAIRMFLTPPRKFPHSAGRAAWSGGDSAERIAAWLRTRPEGEKNLALFWAACRYAEHGLPIADAFTLLGQSAEHIGLPGRDINGRITSAYKRYQGHSL